MGGLFLRALPGGLFLLLAALLLRALPLFFFAATRLLLLTEPHAVFDLPSDAVFSTEGETFVAQTLGAEEHVDQLLEPLRLSGRPHLGLELLEAWPLR